MGIKNIERSRIKKEKNIITRLKKRIVKIEGVSIFYLKELVKKAFSILRKDGFFVFIKYLYKYILDGREYFRAKGGHEDDIDSYNVWIKKNEKVDTEGIKKEISGFRYNPKISIITPVYNVDAVWLEKCIRSVRGQFYSNWELCLYDDASSKKETIECLKRWDGADKRIKVVFGKENQGISGASNGALHLATGEFVAFLDNDDELSRDALFEVVKLLNERPEADLVYSDEDKLEVDGKRVSPFFKPGWSLDLLLSMNYICHLTVCRKQRVQEVGGFRAGFDGAQDYDLLLRLIEKIPNSAILHISKILYHWRKIPGSTAERFDSKNYVNDVAKKALAEYLQRNFIEGSVEIGRFPGTYRVKRAIKRNALVSIIIPFRDQAEVLKKCVESILRKTNYENFEILLVDNQSQDVETIEYLSSLDGNKKIRIISYDKPFNFSAINNFAVEQAFGDFVLCLNNDTEVISNEWLCSMVEHIERNDIGVVGAKLIYPNNTIQHAGVIMGTGIAGHAFKYFPSHVPGYFSMLAVIRNYCAVTGACLLMKKSFFQEIGGFDEKNLAIAYNDVDLCLRVLDMGYSIVYTPYAELYHYESLSRGNDEELRFKNPKKYKRVVAEREYMMNKWKRYIEDDPYYSLNLTRKSENFGIRQD